MNNHGERGFSLIELLTVVAIIGLTVAVSMPAFNSMRRRSAVVAASADVRGILQNVRSRAIARARNAGVKFTLNNGVWTFAQYDDGDGDGVRNDDIVAGIDRRASMSQPVLSTTKVVRIGLPSMRIADPDGGWLAANASPVQFGNSTICSFSPTGQSTSGTLFMSDGADSLYAVRVYGASAKTRIIRYDFRRARWEAR